MRGERPRDNLDFKHVFDINDLVLPINDLVLPITADHGL